MAKRRRPRLSIIIGLIAFAVIFSYTQISLMAEKNDTVEKEEDREIISRILGPLSSDDAQLISHVKKFYLVPPSNEPYNLSDGLDITYERASKTGTWPYIHFFLKVFFTEEKPGFFVEAGALDGEFLSNSLWLEQHLGWTGLLVEPDELSFSAMQSKHRRAWTSKSCLSKEAFPRETIHVSWHVRDKRNTPWMHHANAHEFGVTSKVKNVKFSMLSDKTYSKVQCIPLSTFLYALNVTQVDFLSLDVQGSEKEILRTLDWEKIKIRVMFIESNEDAIDEEFVTFIEEKGFVLANRKDAPKLYDYLYIGKDEKKLLQKLKQYFIRIGPNSSFVMEKYEQVELKETTIHQI